MKSAIAVPDVAGVSGLVTDQAGPDAERLVTDQAGPEPGRLVTDQGGPEPRRLVTDQARPGQANLSTAQADRPSGSLFTAQAESWTELSANQRRIIEICDVPRSLMTVMAAVGVSGRWCFRTRHLDPLLRGGVLRMPHPDQPSHPDQTYVRCRTRAQGPQRIRTVRLDEACRLIHRRHQDRPLGMIPAPNRFSDPLGGYSVLYATQSMRCAVGEAHTRSLRTAAPTDTRVPGSRAGRGGDAAHD